MSWKLLLLVIERDRPIIKGMWVLMWGFIKSLIVSCFLLQSAVEKPSKDANYCVKQFKKLSYPQISFLCKIKEASSFLCIPWNFHKFSSNIETKSFLNYMLNKTWKLCLILCKKKKFLQSTIQMTRYAVSSSHWFCFQFG